MNPASVQSYDRQKNFHPPAVPALFALQIVFAVPHAGQQKKEVPLFFRKIYLNSEKISLTFIVTLSKRFVNQYKLLFTKMQGQRLLVGSTGPFR